MVLFFPILPGTSGLIFGNVSQSCMMAALRTFGVAPENYDSAKTQPISEALLALLVAMSKNQKNS